MKNKNLANLVESAKLVGARLYIIQNIEVDHSIPLFELVRRNAPTTEDYSLSQIIKADNDNNVDQIYFSNFVGICWPKDGEGSLEKALIWAKKNNLKKANARELVSICKNLFYTSEDLSLLDIIKLVSTSPWGEKYFFLHIEGTKDPCVYFTTKEKMNTGDFWFLFRLRD